MPISTYPGLTIRKDGLPPGGTTGQILSKTSNNDFDTDWVTSGALSSTLTNAHIFVGNSSNVATDVAASGDLTVANTGAFTFNTVNSNVGTFGSATQVATPTVNAKGLVTSISNTAIAIPSTAVTDFTEAAQDAVGAMVNTSLTYVDGTPSLGLTSRTIGGVAFDGTANIVPQTIQSVNESTDTTCFPLFISASGSQSLQPLNNTNFTFNSSTGALGFVGATSAGLIQFSGTGHAGFKANNLTTTQRNALTASAGMVVFDTNFNDYFTYNGSNWVQLHPTPIADTTIVHNAAQTSTTNNLCKFNDTSGTEIRDSGVASSTDGTFASNSDSKLPTEKATKTYVDNRRVVSTKRSSIYYPSKLLTPIPATQLLIAGFTYFISHEPQEAFTLDKTSTIVSGAAGGATNLCRVGLFADSNGVPGALILDCGTIAIGTTGLKEITGLAQSMGPTDFHIGLLPSDNFTVAAWGLSGVGHTQQSTCGMATTNTVLIIQADVTTTYAGGLPATPTLTEVPNVYTPQTYYRL